MNEDLIFNRNNPDVLLLLANLSSDEVFTPPKIVNLMLDMLPQNLFENPDAKFLDPASKSGVFLREIAKRLIKGLENKIPDLEERVNHILHEQLYGIGITELTAFISRRTLYCTMNPQSVFSVCKFDDNEGNIRFENCTHKFNKKGRCDFCGASKEKLERSEEEDTHAYEFIHVLKPERIFDMKFDVVISNPPYQMSFGIDGANKSNAKSIYNLFIDKAIQLNPKYICMITPSRWMTRTAQGIPDEWVTKMITSNKFRIIHDFENASDCFPGVSVMGGVSYFLWDNDYNGKCHYFFHETGNLAIRERFEYLNTRKAGIVIRDIKAYSIIEKIQKIEGDYFRSSDKNFSGLVSPKHFFDNSELLTSNWNDYEDFPDDIHNIKYYVNIKNERTFKWISEKQIPKNKDVKDIHKVYIPAANGSSDFVLGKPFYGEPESVCSQTFLIIGYKHKFNKNECENIISYIQTKFFRYLVSIKKKTQNGPRAVYQFVPMQDFSKSWTDEELYKKYNLDENEISFIESMIRPMELGVRS